MAGHCGEGARGVLPNRGEAVAELSFRPHDARAPTVQKTRDLKTELADQESRGSASRRHAWMYSVSAGPNIGPKDDVSSAIPAIPVVSL